MSKNQNSQYKDTLNLPKSDFPMVYNHKAIEPIIIEIWKKKNLYRSEFSNYSEKNKSKQIFALAWGPPYANGPIHIGHAFNGILKDFVVKSKFVDGKAVHFRCGFDCHGMPIEIKVNEKLGFTNKDQIKKDPVAFKKQCREFANTWIKSQTEGFKRLGIIAEFEDYYSTMNFDTEAGTVESFAKLVEDGFIFRRNKAVPWCFTCGTVLASSEIEYKNKKDPSCYVLFNIEKDSLKKLKDRLSIPFEEKVSFLAWTTTPWTLPLNKALIIHPSASYELVKINEQYVILGAGLLSRFEHKLKSDCEVLLKFDSQHLANLKADHLFCENETVPVVFDEMVGLEDGTAIVHCAPGCGPEDYLVGLKNNLEIYSPISEDGKYTSMISYKPLEGMSVVEGQFFVLKILNENKKLLFKENIDHSYPHCWRCKNYLIFRATKQWFCDLSKNDLQAKTLQSIDKVNFLPEWGVARFKSFIGGRMEWCLSRQRFWGVPITALKCTNCDHENMNQALFELASSIIREKGIEAWDSISVEEILEHVPNLNKNCPECAGNEYKKESDILDVWFESGVLHSSVFKKENPNLFPSSVYFEGSDQHRGWFQSSMLTSIALNDSPCANTIITHGYVLDENKAKMSKSVGNVVAPQDIIEKFGGDCLRLWVASSDFERDVLISEKMFSTISESYRKIRNTCRFMLLNLEDSNIKELFESNLKTNFDWSKIWLEDRLVLEKLKIMLLKVDDFYANYQYTNIVQEIVSFCTHTLSAEYFDMIKDRLYADAKESSARKNAQMTLTVILKFFLHKISPILTFMAEEFSLFICKNEKSIFELEQPSIEKLNEIIAEWDARSKISEFESFAQSLKETREVAFKNVEKLREIGIVKSFLETKVILNLSSSEKGLALLKELKNKFKTDKDICEFLKYWLNVSQVEIVNESLEGSFNDNKWFLTKIIKLDEERCPRCWYFAKNTNHDNLCNRCHQVVSIEK